MNLAVQAVRKCQSILTDEIIGNSLESISACLRSIMDAFNGTTENEEEFKGTWNGK